MNPPVPPASPAAAVIVLHGWGMRPWVMAGWTRRLRAAGWRTRALGYASIRGDLRANAAALLREARAWAGTDTPLHLVGHSLGGILAMQCVLQQPEGPWGRVVLAGTPAQGALAARHLGRLPGGARLVGASLAAWPGCADLAWPAAVPLGVIAGTRALGLGRLLGPLPGVHDGMVRLGETVVPFACDRLVLPVTHAQMLLAPAVAAAVERFLRNGSFGPSTAAAQPGPGGV